MVPSDTEYLMTLAARKIAVAGQLANFLRTPAPNVGTEKRIYIDGVSAARHIRGCSPERSRLEPYVELALCLSEAFNSTDAPNHGVPYIGNCQDVTGSQPDEARSSLDWKNTNR